VVEYFSGVRSKQTSTSRYDFDSITEIGCVNLGVREISAHSLLKALQVV
jgi:hypothetical protein